MLRKNALKRLAIAAFVTTHAVLLGSGHSDPQAGAAGEKRPISIEHRGRAIPNTLEEIVDPTHTAVIVHEMVRDIVAQVRAGADRTVADADSADPRVGA